MVVETVNNVIANAETTSDSSVDAGSSSAIVQSVETQVSLTLQQEGQVSIQQDTVHVEAVTLDTDQASNGLSFASIPQQSWLPGQGATREGTLAGTEVKTFVNASQIPTERLASIRLPANVIDLLHSANGRILIWYPFMVWCSSFNIYLLFF